MSLWATGLTSEAWKAGWILRRRGSFNLTAMGVQNFWKRTNKPGNQLPALNKKRQVREGEPNILACLVGRSCREAFVGPNQMTVFHQSMCRWNPSLRFLGGKEGRLVTVNGLERCWLTMEESYGHTLSRWGSGQGVLNWGILSVSWSGWTVTQRDPWTGGLTPKWFHGGYHAAWRPTMPLLSPWLKATWAISHRRSIKYKVKVIK